MLSRGGFDFAVFLELLQHLGHDFSSLLDVRHLAAAKHNGHLDFVLLLQKSDCAFDFELDVVFARLGTQPNFFRLDLVRVLSGPFLLFVLVLSEIHDAANGRLFVGRDLDQIKPDVSRTLHGL